MSGFADVDDEDVRVASVGDGDGNGATITIERPTRGAQLDAELPAALKTLSGVRGAAPVRESVAVRVVVRGLVGADKSTAQLGALVVDTLQRSLQVAPGALQALNATPLAKSIDGATGDVQYFVVLHATPDGTQLGADLARALLDNAGVVSSALVSVVDGADAMPRQSRRARPARRGLTRASHRIASQRSASRQWTSVPTIRSS